MVTLAVNDIIQVRVGCYTSDQAGINTIHYRVSNTNGDSATDGEFGVVINSGIRSLYESLLGVGAFYRGVSVQRVAPGTRNIPALTIDPIEGSVEGGLLPRQCSGLIKFRTELAGPRYRGRIYIPFPAEDSNFLEGEPGIAYIADLEDLGEFFASTHLVGDGQNGATLVPILYHRDLGTWTDIVDAIAVPSWATQRRRGAFGKQNPRPF